ncbi:MAG: glycosyltransferase family 9 protein [Desulfobacterales bacterium]|nr:glycosyltransferase family 9 protein [Desulfobacterales bacterium]
MDILIVKLGALGDVVNTLPLAVRLHRALDARIHWLIEPLSHPIVAHHPCVAHAILFDRSRWRPAAAAVAKQIRSRRFDAVLDLQRTLKSGSFAMLARARRRIGFDRARCKEMTWLLPFHRIPPSEPTAHMVHQYLEFAGYLGAPGKEIQWEIAGGQPPPRALPEKYAVLNIGATKPANRWPQARWAALAEALWEQLRLPSVVTGGKEDMPAADQIQATVPPGFVNLAGQTRIGQLVHVLQHASVVITCDTGPMHLAVALNIPVVALFGPSDPRRTGPFKGRVVRARVDCAPCNRKTCPDPVCMRHIGPQAVVEQVKALLQ